MSLCRKNKLNFSLSEVLRSKSIHQLAASARFEDERVFQDEKIDEPFDLSPIQQLYFKQKTADEQRPDARFNQSFSLQITRRMEPTAVRNAINKIVQQHSMLRAKFSKISGVWKQSLAVNADNSCRFRVYDVESANNISKIVGFSQSSVDVNGPVFIVDLFNIPGENQVLFLAAHHLVIGKFDSILCYKIPSCG